MTILLEELDYHSTQKWYKNGTSIGNISVVFVKQVFYQGAALGSISCSHQTCIYVKKIHSNFPFKYIHKLTW